MRRLRIPLFTALVIAGTYIRIPLPPVPITLQSLFIMLAALLLDPKEALISAILWIFLGVAGLPVFTSGGGIAALVGPTGGYIIAMALAMPVFALLARLKRDSISYNLLLTLLINLFIYLIGTLYLAYNRKMGFIGALSVGVLPFLIGDAVKMLVASSIAPRLIREFGQREDR